jgi:hypothetical protein
VTGKARNLFIVAPSKARTYESLKRAFEGQNEVEVILDRRRGERRRSLERAAFPYRAERRRGERRLQTDAQVRLARMGLALVEIEAPTLIVSPAADFLQGRRHIS